ncbi:hypothetical protein ACLSU7_09670 [Bdellovibrio sp. HCB185ZH]|uniref:hypothetical protein n=1 Tax=Bdellovibrio sp. HCB185ZH TaxID=3394235 RepID=UPI0039A6AE9B
MNIFFRTFSVLIGSLFLQTGLVHAASADGRSCSSSNPCPSGYECTNINSRNQNVFTCYQNPAKSGSASRTTGTAGTTVCSVQFQRLMAQCSNEISSTDSNCDQKSNQGMNSASAMASQVALAYGAKAASSIAESCTTMAALSSTINAAVAAYRLTCSSAIKDCNSTCSSAQKYLESTPACQTDPNFAAMKGQATSSVNQCASYTAKVGEAQQAMNNIAQTAANATQCASLTSADGSSDLASLCAANPSLAGCENVVMDCNNPAMASNKVCICSKNPSDPSCLGTSNVVGDTGGGLATIDQSSRTGSSASASDFTGDLPNIGIEQAELSSGGSDAGIDGKQGGGVSFGGSGGGSGSGGKPGAEGADPTKSTAVNSGFRGGGGGGGGFGGGGSDGEGQGGGFFNSAANALAAKGGPDLRQFLPGGGKYNPNARGVAGATGPDGITGPHTDIWKKVQNRYQVMSPSLLP